MTKIQKRLDPQALIVTPVAPEHQPVQVLAKDKRSYLLYLDAVDQESLRGRNLRGQKVVLPLAEITEVIIEKPQS